MSLNLIAKTRLTELKLEIFAQYDLSVIAVLGMAVCLT